MKNLLLFCVLIFGCGLFYSCKNNKTNQIETHHLYFVRHAEKADDGTKDPPLTNIGNQRAEKLAELLKDKDIKQIYSTDYKRTKNTAQPLAEAMNLSIEIYNPNDVEFAKRLKDEIKNGSALIVGHSNTTPKLVNAILGEEKYDQLSEDDYGNLFMVRRTENGLEAEVEKY